MKKRTKRILTFGGLFLAVLFVSGCTANFCSVQDKANILYTYEKGISLYEDNSDHEDSVFVFESEGNLILTTRIDYDNSPTLQAIISTAEENKVNVPHDDYFVGLDRKLLVKALESKYGANLDLALVDAEQVNTALEQYGYLKFDGGEDLFTTWDLWTAELRVELGQEKVPNNDFTTLYKSNLEGQISSFRSCITMTEGHYGSYGPDGDTGAFVEGKSWKYAWSKGPIEGLLVYPVAYLVDTFSHAFGMNGWGQIAAVALVTLIVRAIILLTTLKSTLGQQKMQALQPELAKIQQKYPNSNTNQSEKQRLAQEQMALYKKHNIKPLGQILVMVIQFPVFIAVWGAMTGASVLSSDAVLGLRLSNSISSVLTNFNNWPNVGGWWTAVVLFVLMALGQFLAMKLPQWIQKSKTKGVKKLGKNPAQDKQAKQMKWFSNIMLIMIIVMGFSLPAAMGVYWFIGALISIAQTLIMQPIIARHAKKTGR